MSDPIRHPRVTSDAFLAWAIDQPGRYELLDGEVIAMAPERSAHALMKLKVALCLTEAVRTAKLPCTVYPDGMAVTVDKHTTYEPDGMVRCGDPLHPDAITVPDPIILVEVASPSTRSIDSGAKLSDYFRLPSVRHYLIVRTDGPAIIHHARDDHGAIATRIIREGDITLDPPGLLLRGLFES